VVPKLFLIAYLLWVLFCQHVPPCSKEKSMWQIPEMTQMQHEENGCEKVLWPFLETNKGSRLHKSSEIC